jgi:hypothetical protein
LTFFGMVLHPDTTSAVAAITTTTAKLFLNIPLPSLNDIDNEILK